MTWWIWPVTNPLTIWSSKFFIVYLWEWSVNLFSRKINKINNEVEKYKDMGHFKKIISKEEIASEISNFANKVQNAYEQCKVWVKVDAILIII